MAGWQEKVYANNCGPILQITKRKEESIYCDYNIYCC